MYLSNFFKNKNKINKRTQTSINMLNLLTFRTRIFITLCTLGLFSSQAIAALTVTAEMSPEVKAAYKKSLAAQTWPQMHTKLAFMDNPYKLFDRTIKKKLRKEAPEGQKRRLRTKEESLIGAKKMRFDHCQAAVTFFVDFAKRSHALTIIEDNPLTEDQLKAGNGVAYPFTVAETKNGKTRPTQLALELGWDHKGKGEQYAEQFLATCLAEPISLYYQEDK